MTYDDLASKEVVGALIGAAGAFVAAMWVARDARRREERSAAMATVATLGNLVAAAKAIEDGAPAGVSDDDAARYVAGQLVRFFPGLGPMYAACVARLMPLHIELAKHLHMVSMVHESMGVCVDRLCTDAQKRDEKGAPERTLEAMDADARTLAAGLKRIAKHSALARELLNRLVLSRWGVLQRIGLRFGLCGSPLLKQALQESRAAIHGFCEPSCAQRAASEPPHPM